MRQVICYFFGILLLLLLYVNSSESALRIEKSPHFILEYPENASVSWAGEIINKAELYYDRIGNDLGFTRYKNFWTWDNRAKISIYKDQETFIEKTGQPSWSLGGASYGRHYSQGRSIISFKQQNNFTTTILPHELSHLILRDFIGFNKVIPVWFDEGVAQLFEAEKKYKAEIAMRNWLKKNKAIPFQTLFSYNVSLETNPIKVSIFYIQTVTIIDFLIKKYGSAKFGKLCRFMRDGKSFEVAFEKAYKARFSSISDFEKKWLNYMKSN